MPTFTGFVFCIFSYNRYKYLQNLVNSIDIFFPGIDVVIFDDQSKQKELLALYDSLNKRNNYRIIKQKKRGELSKHGGLYNLMNLALEYCWKKDYTYAFFIQDDMQFVQQIDLDNDSKHYFSKWKNAFMVSPLFMQKIFLPEINAYIEEKNNDYLFKNYGVADAGIIHLERAKNIKLNFNVKGEKYNGTKYFQMGYNLILTKNPCLAWVPWAISYKNDKKRGICILRNNQVFIKPLSDQDRRKLKKNRRLPYLEDYTRLNVWWIPKPYIHLILSFRQIIYSYWKYWKYVILGR